MNNVKDALQKSLKDQVVELISEVERYNEVKEQKKVLNESISIKIESINEISDFIGNPFVNVHGQQLMVKKLTRSATDILKK